MLPLFRLPPAEPRITQYIRDEITLREIQQARESPRVSIIDALGFYSRRAERVARAQRAARTERAACKRRGRKHLGGPGRADCTGGIEVKDWARPVDSGTVKREARKGRREIVARGGFTEPARKEARKLGVRLRRS